jgi:hypothetical protein
MIVTSQLALKTHKNFGCAASLATLDKLIVHRFSVYSPSTFVSKGAIFHYKVTRYILCLVTLIPLQPVAPPIGDTSLTHVMRLVPLRWDNH